MNLVGSKIKSSSKNAKRELLAERIVGNKKYSVAHNSFERALASIELI